MPIAMNRRPFRHLTTWLVVLLLGGAAAAAALAQWGGTDESARAPLTVPPNTAYDGRFKFARLKFTTGPGGYYFEGLPAWAHGYPRAEHNLMRILNALTDSDPHLNETDVLALDDPELCKYPVAYMSEPAFLTMTDHEVVAFREYLQKGGFVIFDDFREYFDGTGWGSFQAQMHRVIPEGRFLDLDPSHPIFHAFFDVTALDRLPQYYDVRPPVLRALFEDNDSSKRMLAMVNFNTDVSNFWEFSDTGLTPIDDSNEAYKLGVNYVVYGLTH
jgi:hypothetical protein